MTVVCNSNVRRAQETYNEDGIHVSVKALLKKQNKEKQSVSNKIDYPVNTTHLTPFFFFFASLYIGIRTHL